MQVEHTQKLAGAEAARRVETVEAPGLDVPRLEPDALPAAARRVLAGSELPLLLPRAPELLESAVAVRGEHWASVTMRAGGVTVVLLANREATVRPGLARELTDQIEPAESLTHGIATLSFRRFGVAYGLDVECAEPGRDSRCADTTYARQLHRELAWVTP